jgi:hypothetical protein
MCVSEIGIETKDCSASWIDSAYCPPHVGTLIVENYPALSYGELPQLEIVYRSIYLIARERFYR